MFNKQLKSNIKQLDIQIGKLTEELAVAVGQEEHEMIMTKIEDLTKVRGSLAEDKVRESYSKEIVSGFIGITAVLIVLKYEKTEIITSKGFGLATKLFRGV